MLTQLPAMHKEENGSVIRPKKNVYRNAFSYAFHIIGEKAIGRNYAYFNYVRSEMNIIQALLFLPYDSNQTLK